MQFGVFKDDFFVRGVVDHNANGHTLQTVQPLRLGAGETSVQHLIDLFVQVDDVVVKDHSGQHREEVSELKVVAGCRVKVSANSCVQEKRDNDGHLPLLVDIRELQQVTDYQIEVAEGEHLRICGG